MLCIRETVPGTEPQFLSQAAETIGTILTITQLVPSSEGHMNNNTRRLKGNYTYSCFQEYHKKLYVVKIKKTNIIYTRVMIF
jgi:hypothetical protein